MKNILLLLFSLLLFQNYSFTQDTDLYSPRNRKLFADFLYCQKDYLRAADEYKEILKLSDVDTLHFKIGLSYLKIGNYDSASVYFNKINVSSLLYNYFRQEYYKTQFHLNHFDIVESGSKLYNPVDKLYKFSCLLGYSPLPEEKEKLLSPFDVDERSVVSDFYDRKLNPPYKNELTAAILSTLIPGAGKIYTHEYSDGIYAFLVTGLMSYISYTDFRAHHQFREWLFAGLAAFFYGGNIYGSIASVQIYNAGINFKLNSDMKLYLDDNNYFVPDYDFCK